MKYALTVEVKLIEVPDDEPLSEVQLGDDPIKGMVSVIGGMAGKIGAISPYQQPAGFDFRKQTEVRVSGFTALAAIIGRFDELVTDIEHEKLQV